MESKNISEPYKISTSSTNTTTDTTLYQEKKNFQMGPPPFSSPSDHQIFTPDSQNFASMPPHYYQLLHHQSNQSHEFYPHVISPGFVYPSMFPLFPLMVDQNRADHHILPTSLMGGFFDGVFPNKQIDQNQMDSSPTVVPELHLPEQWDSSISKAARSKRRMARQMNSNHISMLGNLFSSITSSSGRSSRKKRPSSSSTAIPNNNKDFYTFITPDNKQLKFILQKELKHSDVSSLGRIVLPKKDSEANLPSLTVKEGIQIIVREVEFSRLWCMRYRFWPNNKSRMYVLENTGDFVRQNELKRGDFIMLYKDDKDKLYISCKKAKPAPSVPLEEEESERQVGTSSSSSSVKKFNETVTEEGTLINQQAMKTFHGASSTTQLKIDAVVDHETSCIKDLLKEGDSLQLEDSFFFDIDRCDFSELERFQDFDDCDLSLYDDIVKDFNGDGNAN